MGKVDANHDYVAMAATDEIDSQAAPLLIDEGTGRLLIVIYPVDSSVPVLNATRVDDNREPASKAVTDDVVGNIQPLLIDSRNGYLWCDVLEET